MDDRGSKIKDRRSRQAGFIQSLLLGLIVLSFFLPHPSSLLAQTPDSSAIASPDTLRPPVGFAARPPGHAVTDTILALSPEPDVADILSHVPGSFVYEFGALGWPDGWSPFGLNPRHVALTLNGLPFTDLATGRPRYDLLPTAWLEPLAWEAGRFGAPVVVHAQVRPFTVQQPLTELNYRTSNTGLQSVMALHTQRRRRSLFGQDGVVGLFFGYGGHASEGEYPGSRLRRMRQILGRVRYEQRAWSLELSALHNRRSLGAHGGVLPQAGFGFESVYVRLGAEVENPNARRRTLRTDFAATLRVRLLPGAASPITGSAYWTKQYFQYRNPGADTLTTRINRFGGRLFQDVHIGAHDVRLLAEGWTDRLADGSALPDSLGLSRTALHLTARDALRLGDLALTLEARLHATEAATYPSGLLHVAYEAGAIHPFAEIAYASQPISWIEQYGFGALMRPTATVPDSRVTHGRAGLSLRSGPFDATLFGFAHAITNPFDLYQIGESDTVAVQTLAEAFERFGAGADLGWRRTARRGFYLTLQPTTGHTPSSPETSHLEAALPAFFLNARFGMRYRLFRDDLDLDASLQGRFWTEMRSRTLHAPTGLLVLPPTDARPVDTSGTLDLVLLGGIRAATLFIAYENLLSGTELIFGNQIVPVYPLPERRFRFGIYWPIEN